MKKGGGKAKGSDFERLICRKLTHWITGSEKPEIFWRSGGSGSVFTRGKSNTKGGGNMPGDLMAIHAKGQWLCEAFSIECKSYKDYRLEKVLTEKKDHVTEWWMQACDDAKKSSRFPMLIFKRNRGEIFIGIDNRCITRGMNDWGIAPRVSFSSCLIRYPRGIDMYVVELDRFLQESDPMVAQMCVLMSSDAHSLGLSKE